MKEIPTPATWAPSGGGTTTPAAGSVRESLALPAVVAEAFERLDAGHRPHLLRCLLASVGPLALSVVGGGAFARYVKHARRHEIPVSVEDAACATPSQVYELARYVQQSDPQLFGRLFDRFSRDPATIAALGASIPAFTIDRLAPRGGKGPAMGSEL